MWTLIFMSLLILQPQKFIVSTSSWWVNSSVYAQIKEVWNSDDWALQFEELMPGGDIWGKIVYSVKSWDSLSQIAKNFGTTTKRLLESNTIADPNSLIKGQKLEIPYAQDDIIYEIDKDSTVVSFADEYDLDVDDLMTLNYFEDKQTKLVNGQQIFLDLTREQAELKGLRQQPVYERPAWLVEDLPEDPTSVATPDTPSESDSVLDEIFELWDSENTDDTWGETLSEEWLLDTETWEVEQNVITAEQTSDRLDEPTPAELRAIEEEKKRLEEEKRKAEEEKRLAEEKIRIEKEAKIKAEKERISQEEARRQLELEAEQKRKAEEARRKAEEEKRKAEAASAAQTVIDSEETTEKLEQLTSCGENKCLHNNRCWSLPANWYCTPDDADNAWLCKEWYVETRRSCVEKSVYAEQTSTRGSQPVKKWTTAQWYFNPYNDGYSNGWWWGHCTHYSWWYWWKHYGIMTNWRGNWWQWYWNASAAGWQVGSVPEVWSIFVASAWSWVWSSYGHVGIVIAVDWESNSIKVSDMNYAWRYIVTERWMPMNSKWLIWYVYPRRK